MKAVGNCKVRVVNPKNNRKYRVNFVIVDGINTPLLGARAVLQMKLLTVNYENILKVEGPAPQFPTLGMDKPLSKCDLYMKFNDVFEGEVGKLPGMVHLEVDPSVKPVRMPLRRVPLAMRGILRQLLERLSSNAILAKVDYDTPTEWCHSLVVVKKPNGKLRVCIDPKPLNKALKRSPYLLPVLDDILPELSKAKVFSVCDVKNGYWHCQLDEESSYLTTFETPFGRYRWRVMPFGLNTASEHFQARLDQALENLPGVHIIADDILIAGEGDTMEEAVLDHDRKLVKLLERCQRQNIVLNKDKFKLRLAETPFMGNLLTSEGLKPDPNKVAAVKKMQRPTDVAGVRRLVGFVNYLARFLKQLTDIIQPIRQLMRPEIEWHWTHAQEEAFTKMKEAVASAPVLCYFDPGKETTVQCDASDTGLGAALMQEGQPVWFASRALSDTERNYAQIEKELLAIVFGMERFNQLTYGRKVTVESDHKPLEVIYKKPLMAAPKRLQSMLLRLQSYDIEITYKQGREMYLADTLSRAYLPQTGKPTQDGEILSLEKEIEQINMAEYLPISDPKLREIQTETEHDESLQVLKTVILDGWPELKQDAPMEVHPYFHVRDELSVQNGIVFRGSRCIIPATMRASTLQKIHSSHLGIEGCLRRARDCLYWPNMNMQVKDYIEKCDICRKYEISQQRETLQSHDIPTRPWQKVGTDLFMLDDNDYLVTVDYYSNFWEVDKLEDTKSKTVVRKLKAHFARYGIPDQVVSDNGPQYSSDEFAQFAHEWGFEHTTSSPGHSQSNGKAESAVKIAKRLLRKATDAKTDVYIAMLDHRNTPSEAISSSPAQRLMNRRTKTLLPTTGKLLQPSVRPHEAEKEKLQKRQEKQAGYYNKVAKDLPPCRKVTRCA
jgi:hypothetical protein